MTVYRVHDQGLYPGAVEIREDEIAFFNSKGWGIFYTVNEFDGPRRVHALKTIRAWYAETDELPKNEVLKLIAKAPLKPTSIIESKRGYHLLYAVSGKATLENYAQVCRGLSLYYHGDRLCDVTRVLRMPGTYHCKTDERFLVTEIYRGEDAYTEDQMLAKFPFSEAPRGKDSGLMLKGDCRRELGALSGSEYVRGEEFTFQDNLNGTAQIFVNGKKTGCWIDEEGWIGSYKGGGPTTMRWLMFYGHTKKEAFNIVRRIQDGFRHHVSEELCEGQPSISGSAHGEYR